MRKTVLFICGNHRVIKKDFNDDTIVDGAELWFQYLAKETESRGYFHLTKVEGDDSLYIAEPLSKEEIYNTALEALA